MACQGLGELLDFLRLHGVEKSVCSVAAGLCGPGACILLASLLESVNAAGLE